VGASGQGVEVGNRNRADLCGRTHEKETVASVVSLYNHRFEENVNVFTGIVERTAEVHLADRDASGLRLGLQVSTEANLPDWRPVEIGESIAVDGACLTTVARSADTDTDTAASTVEFDVVPETLEKTSLGSLAVGERVNIERSLRVGDPFGGHYVTGHVDGTGTVESREIDGDQVLFTIAAPRALLRQMLAKGSIAVDGISLTLIDVEPDAGCFTFAAIPHTLARTTLGARQAGSRVNLETDAFGKWVLHGLAEGAS